MPKNKSPEQAKKEARRALIIWLLATAFFVFAMIYYLKVEGG